MIQYRVLNDFGGMVGGKKRSFARGKLLTPKQVAAFPNLRSLEKSGFLIKEEIDEDEGGK